MNGIPLDARLARDCHILGRMDSGRLLLLNNALFPWLVLVPDTEATEIYQLEFAMQTRILEDINRICSVMREHIEFDKMNIGAIGNIVQQLHIHLVARRRDDLCWPGVVWGTGHSQPYNADAVDHYRRLFSSLLNGNGSAT